jgi:hypothetical protein
VTGRPYAVPVPKGYRIGPWEVREPLASGAFATVYDATRAADGGEGELPRRAALKFLPTGTRTPRQLHHLRDLAEARTNSPSSSSRTRLTGVLSAQNAGIRR